MSVYWCGIAEVFTNIKCHISHIYFFNHNLFDSIAYIMRIFRCFLWEKYGIFTHNHTYLAWMARRNTQLPMQFPQRIPSEYGKYVETTVQQYWIDSRTSLKACSNGVELQSDITCYETFHILFKIWPIHAKNHHKMW